MNRRLGTLVVLILVLAGCGREASPPAAPESTASASGAPTSSAVEQNPGGQSGNIPDPCTLLSDAEVTELTGRDITQIDKDGEGATAPTRYCQWQQSSGQLAVFITRTTRDDFKFAQADSPSISGIGDDAFWRDGHLYVLVGTSHLDVYSRGGDESQSQAEAEKVAAALVPKVLAFS